MVLPLCDWLLLRHYLLHLLMIDVLFDFLHYLPKIKNAKFVVVVQNGTDY